MKGLSICAAQFLSFNTWETHLVSVQRRRRERQASVRHLRGTNMLFIVRDF